MTGSPNGTDLFTDALQGSVKNIKKVFLAIGSKIGVLLMMRNAVAKHKSKE
jgi:hypothetical protein